MPSSPFDELHDRLYSDPSKPIKKAGTRYERLMAAVARALHDEKDVVVHDIRLRGESDVHHQIDVLVSSKEPTATRKRVLIECKDFSASENKVGLDIVRDFSAVVSDIQPTEAVIVTCIGFTADAIKFAEHKGIRLAKLQFPDTLEQIQIRLTLFKPELKHVNFLTDPATEARIHQALSKHDGPPEAQDDEPGEAHAAPVTPDDCTPPENEPHAAPDAATPPAGETVTVKQHRMSMDSTVRIRFGDQDLPLFQHIETLFRTFTKGWWGTQKSESWNNDSWLVFGNEEPIPISGLAMSIVQHATEDLINVAGARIAALILSFLDEKEARVIYQDELGDAPPKSAGEM